jgi:hypothetical protein
VSHLHVHIRLICRLLASLTLGVLGSSVHAQVPVASTASAREAQREGDRLRDAGDLRGALDHYVAAHAVLGEPTSGLRVANTQAELGLLVEARQTAAATAAIPRARGESGEVARARKAAERLATAIEPRLSMFEVTVNPVTPYTLRIDGWLVPENMHTLRFRTNPGEHTLEVEAPGFRETSQQFTLAEGAYQVFLVSLARESEPAAAAPVAKALEPAPPAKEQSVAEPPPAPTQPPARARANEPPADPALTAQKTRGYVALAVGGAVLAGGAVAGIVSFVETSNAKDSCTADLCPSRLRTKLETADTLAVIANIALPLGVLGIGYGLFELFTASEKPSPVQVQISAEGAYATWRGSL